MRVELKELTTRLHITTVFVTHDQLEALTLSDQIAVMRDGVIEQEGSAEEIYATPNSRFTAEFIGTTNLVEGEVTQAAEDGMRVAGLGGELSCAASSGFATGDKVVVAIRPESLVVETTKGKVGENTFPGIVESVIYLGDSLDCRIRVGENLLRAFVRPQLRLAPGDPVFVSMNASECRPLPFESAFVEKGAESLSARPATGQMAIS
jgi:iron(III) transport system ATP-binding protein